MVRERLVGLCRESPFTALASGATFAVQMIGLTSNQVRREASGQAGQRAASLLNIIELSDGFGVCAGTERPSYNKLLC